MKSRLLVITILCLLLSSCRNESVIWLDTFHLDGMTSGKGAVFVNQSAMEKPLSVSGKIYSRGVGTHAVSTFMLDLDGRSVNITGKAGVDDAAAERASVRFYLVGDHEVLWDSQILHAGDSAVSFYVELRNIKKLGFLVTDAGDGIEQDYVDWVDVRISYKGKVPAVARHILEEPYLLTPPTPEEPRINGPKVYGVRPGSPFIYRIPCTGNKPIVYTAKSLPDGLFLDSEKGIITGKILSRGTYETTLMAKNNSGECARKFRIVVGDSLMLTPSMGWNSWYIHYDRVSDSIMRNAADQMIGTGMADYGYQYVNIDDCWMIKNKSDDPVIGGDMRDKEGNILTNKRFPDMKSLTAYIHDQGLKAGIYTSPGPTTCGNYTGSYRHEARDARTFANWGFDFLKYDWCSYDRIAPDHSLESLKAPYILMWNELKKLDRDIVLNLCQYGMGEVWTWGNETGNSWRTTGDLGLMRGLSMPGFFYIGRSNADHWKFARPGNWNDPDYILIGWVGNAFVMGEGMKTNLSPSEQYFYMSMWSLMASPLMFSGDMGKLDDFTLNVLCNHEVIEIDQDPLGRQGRIIREDNDEMVMIRDLEDGSLAVGLFHITGKDSDPAGYLNWGEPVKTGISSQELGIPDRFSVRDVWQQKDLGVFTGKYETELPYHGVKLLKILKAP
jgi:alpha-galactosidase